MEMFGVMTSAVAPRPICFASTVDKDGNVNLSPYSYFNAFSTNPPTMVFSPARSGRDAKTKNTHDNVLDVPEVVINIVNYPIVEQMSLSSTAYDKGVNEFIKSGLTEVPSDLVQPPRVGESPVAFECKVKDVIELGQGPGSGNLVVCEILRVHIKTEYLNQEGKLDTTKLDLVARLGGNWYARMIPEALFEITKPIKNKGIGIDQLPEYIRHSEILSGNDLGKLGNVERLPNAEEIQQAKNDSSNIHNYELYAKELLKKGKTWEALCLLVG